MKRKIKNREMEWNKRSLNFVKFDTKSILGKAFYTIILVFFFLYFSSCYSFTGSSLSPDVKTIQIKDFLNNAAYVNPRLSQDFTVALQSRFLQRTSLKGTNESPDILIEGEIVDYQISPTTISNSIRGEGIVQAAQNKLVISVRVRYENKIEKEKSFDKMFSDEAIFSSDLDIYAIESAQVGLVNEKIINKIFNEIVANW